MFIYAIRAAGTDLVKIGISQELQRRLTQLQTGCPYRLAYIVAIDTPHASEAERYVHGQLQAVRCEGEWFRVATDQEAHDWVVGAVSVVSTRKSDATPWHAVKKGFGYSFDDVLDLIIGRGLTEDDYRRLFKGYVAEHAIARHRAAQEALVEPVALTPVAERPHDPGRYRGEAPVVKG